MNKELETIVNDLKKSPLFNLSLASKELFHSNFLYWLSRYKWDVFVSVMSQLANQENNFDWDKDKCMVFREKNNFDLSVWNNNKVIFVLENKVKSIPYENQLNKYTNESEGAIHILLSLTEMQNCPKDWVQKNYCNLSKILTSFVPNDNSYGGLLIKDYAEYIKNLHNLSTKWGGRIKVNKELGDWLEELRLDDVCQKSLFSSLCMELENNLNGNCKHIDKFEDIIIDDRSDVKFYTRYDMMHGEGLFEVAFKKDGLIYEIMIQGNKYQHMIYGLGNNDKVVNDNYPFVFSEESYPKDIFVGRLSGEGKKKENGYNSYKDRKAEKLTFYKYFTLKDDITNNDLIDKVIKDLKKWKSD